MYFREELKSEYVNNFSGWLLAELIIADAQARKGKRGTFDEHKWEVNKMENLIELRDSLLDRTYRPSRGTAHVIKNPVLREIFAAPYRDRVVHHFIYNQVYDWWDKRFIRDSYSCREGKGTLYGIRRLAAQIQSCSDNFQRKNVWAIKLDIQGYFMSLPREQLLKTTLDGLDRQFKKNWSELPKEARKQFKWSEDELYQLLRFLWEKIVLDDPVREVRRKGWPKAWETLPPSKSLFNAKPGVGIVIGNLTSQLLSNIYLDQLDKYVTKELGYKYYGRYVDDFFIIVEEKDLAKALKDIEHIANFLERLGLTLHPKKRKIQPVERGVDFLGAVVYPGRVFPGKRILKNANVAFHEVAAGIRDLETVVSYLGHMRHLDSRKKIAELYEQVGWDYNW